jgi:hypothetical protein
VIDRDDIAQLLEELGEDQSATISRINACKTMSQGLVRIGSLLWLCGYFVGPDRASGSSPYNFGDDSLVGIATVSQIGGELATGAVTLLEAENRYAASCLARQLVEVEYLACAFAAEDSVAADWLRADSAARRTFWSPAQLRKRADSRFLSTDYWSHCDTGGHPATSGMPLLPDHKQFPIAFLWVDLASHLEGIWRGVVKASGQLLMTPIPASWDLPDVQGAIDTWHECDRFRLAAGELKMLLQDDPGALDGIGGSSRAP